MLSWAPLLNFDSFFFLSMSEKMCPLLQSIFWTGAVRFLHCCEMFSKKRKLTITVERSLEELAILYSLRATCAIQLRELTKRRTIKALNSLCRQT